MSAEKQVETGFTVLPTAPPRPPTALPPRRKPNYVELLHQRNPAMLERSRLPYFEQLRLGETDPQPRSFDQTREAAIDVARHAKFDAPLQEALAKLLAHTLASGRDMISGREIFWRLRVPPNREACERRALARVLRSLGWVRVRTGKGPAGQQTRVWGWRWREWNISQIKVDLKS